MGFNWEKYWKDTNESETATNFALGMADRLKPIFDTRHVFLFADFGCGPASMIFKLAETYPETLFYGFDIAESVIEENTQLSCERELDNIFFVKDSLPYPVTRLSFDVVTCFSTLHYLEEIEPALVNLYRLVNSGGYLIFNYLNLFTMRMYQRDLAPDDIVMRTRFKVLLAGQNILTQKRIGELLGSTPRKFYSKIRGNIYLKIRKPTAPSIE